MAKEKETYLTPAQVSARWDDKISTKTLANWRSDPSGSGPPFMRFGNRVLYPESKLEAWEAEHTFTTTATYGQAKAA